MSKSRFSDRMLPIMAHQFVSAAQAGNTKQCWLIFHSMVHLCRAFGDCTVKLAKEAVAETINDQIAVLAAKAAKPLVAPMRELKVCLKAPMSSVEEMVATGHTLVSLDDFNGEAGEGAA